MIVRSILALAFILTAFFGLYEVRRWAALPEAARISHRQRRIRQSALFFLLAALSMCFYGTFLPVHQSHKTTLTRADKVADLRYIIHWNFTALLALPLIPLALLDMRETLIRVQRERIAARNESVGTV